MCKCFLRAFTVSDGNVGERTIFGVDLERVMGIAMGVEIGTSVEIAVIAGAKR